MGAPAAEGSLFPFIYHYFSLVMLECILEKTLNWASERDYFLFFFVVNELKTCYLSKYFSIYYQDFFLI